jgi:hypothetical protein
MKSIKTMSQMDMLNKLTQFQLEIERAHESIGDGNYTKSQEHRKRAAEFRADLAAFILDHA